MRQIAVTVLWFEIFAALLSPLQAAPPEGVLELGSRRELFVDTFLVDRLEGATRELQKPRDEGVAFSFDKPWEGRFCGYVTIIRDGEIDRAYYRGSPNAGGDGSNSEVTCVAESRGGKSFSKPSLGLFEVAGSKDNNVILAGMAPFSHNFCPMLDTRKGTPADQRYKALAGTRKTGLLAFASSDGLKWEKLREEPVFTKGAFDSQNVPLWSEAEQKYLCFFRVFENNIRRIARTESTDFVNWSEPVLMEYGGQPVEHLYTNQTHPYFRAPHILIGVAARFMPGRQVLTAEQAKAVGVDPGYFRDCSDGVLLSTRGGNQYDRSLMDGFLRPGVGLENWVSRTNYPALNIVPTGDAEMSLYANQNYGQPTSHLRRYSLRTDGFVAVHAPYSGGTLITKPVRFEGDELTVNFSTSAAGGVRIEVQTSEGQPVPGFALDDCQELIGNEIDRVVRWRNGSDVRSLAGKPVRLKFALKDAELFSFQFRKESRVGWVKRAEG
jgi:hypothetical protein